MNPMKPDTSLIEEGIINVGILISIERKELSIEPRNDGISIDSNVHRHRSRSEIFEILMIPPATFTGSGISLKSKNDVSMT
jgi:hypothetical protein